MDGPGVVVRTRPHSLWCPCACCSSSPASRTAWSASLSVLWTTPSPLHHVWGGPDKITTNNTTYSSFQVKSVTLLQATFQETGEKYRLRHCVISFHSISNKNEQYFT